MLVQDIMKQKQGKELICEHIRFCSYSYMILYTYMYV
jgi:hypothetical protein